MIHRYKIVSKTLYLKLEYFTILNGFYNFSLLICKPRVIKLSFYIQIFALILFLQRFSDEKSLFYCICHGQDHIIYSSRVAKGQRKR